MDFSEVPIGFGMALMENEDALNAFAMMTKEQKQTIWNRAHQARSETDMQKIVASIAKGQ